MNCIEKFYFKTIKQRWLTIVLCALSFVYTIWYLSLTPNPESLDGTISIIGLDHPFLFAVWALLAQGALFFGQRLLFYHFDCMNVFVRIMTALSLLSIVLTVCVPYDVEDDFKFYTHCASAISFIVVNAVIMIYFFFKNRKIKLFLAFGIITVITVLSMLAGFKIFGESGILEAVPMWISQLLLGISAIFKSNSKSSKSQNEQMKETIHK